MNEAFLDYTVKFDAKAANDYAKRGNFYQAGLKCGAVTALIGCLDRMGFSADCECESTASGMLIFKLITVNGEKIFKRS